MAILQVDVKTLGSDHNATISEVLTRGTGYVRSLAQAYEPHPARIWRKRETKAGVNSCRGASLCALIACCFLSLTAPASGGENSKLEAVLELPSWDDFLTIDAQSAAKECSAALADKQPLSRDQRVRICKVRGQAYLKLGKTAEGKTDFDRVLKIVPNDKEARAWQASARYALGEQKEALAEFEKLFRSEPQFALPYVMVAEIELRRGDPASCIDHATKAISLYESSDVLNIASANSLRAFAYYNQGDYRKCIDDFTKALTYYPLTGGTTPGTIYLWRGKAFAKLGWYEVAIANVQMARKLDPSCSFDAVLEMWEAHRQMGHHNLASQLAADLLLLEKNNPKALLAAAASYNDLKKYEEASGMAKKAIALDPENAEAYRILGTAYNSLGEYRTARALYENALDLDFPRRTQSISVDVAWFLATCPDAKYRDGKRARSLAQDACRRTDQKNIPARLTLAAALAECGEFKQARQMVTELLALLNELLPRNPPNGFELKQILEELKRDFDEDRPYHQPKKMKTSGQTKP